MRRSDPTMCQLLGMSANKPVSAAFSLGGFFLRGGGTDHHADGWGLGFYEGSQCRVLTDERPAARSPLAEQVLARSIRSRNLIAHVRRATQGAVQLSNCHPFQRELWGRAWLFAHNGDLKGFGEPCHGPYASQGETDSEHAFCVLLNSLRARFGTHDPGRAAVAHALQDLSDGLAAHGAFNFLISDGEALFARCSTELHHIERRYPFSRAQLVDNGECIDFAAHNHHDDCVTVIATRPLTCDESWSAFKAGELKVFVQGAEWSDAEWPSSHEAPPPLLKSGNESSNASTHRRSRAA